MEKIGYKIKLVHNKIRNEIIRNEVFQKSNMTRTEFMVLKYVLSNKKQLCIKDIQDEFNINRSTASELLTSLESKNLVEKIINEKDSRIKYINVTSLGNTEFKKVLNEFSKIDQKICEDLTKEEVIQLDYLLSKLL